MTRKENNKKLKPKKIALVGAMGSGKTTLFNAYFEKLKKNQKAFLVPEAGRTYLELNPKVDRTLTKTQVAIQAFALKNEKKAHKETAGIIICDNSILSAAAHLIVFGRKKEAHKAIKEIEFWLPTYSMFFVLNPKDVKYINDSIRTEDINFRNNLQEAYLRLLKEKNLPFQIINGTVEERMQTINNFLAI